MPKPKSVSYSNHVGRRSDKSNGGRSTNIGTSAQLAHCEQHLNHLYTESEVALLSSNINLENTPYNRLYIYRDGELIKTDYLPIVDLVKEQYHELFDDAIVDYNERMIKAGKTNKCLKSSCFEAVSNNQRMDILVNGIIQFGCMDDWRDKGMDDFCKAADVLIDIFHLSINTINRICGNCLRPLFLAIHLDEESPHLHWGAISIAREHDNPDRLAIRISKSASINRETLGALQDMVRSEAERLVYDAFGWCFNEKKKGRNKDLTKDQYIYSQQMKKSRETASNGDDRMIDVPHIGSGAKSTATNNQHDTLATERHEIFVTTTIYYDNDPPPEEKKKKPRLDDVIKDAEKRSSSYKQNIHSNARSHRK